MLLSKRFNFKLSKTLVISNWVDSFYVRNISEVLIKELPSEIESKILFNSVIDNKKLKLGYTKKVILNDLIRKHDFKERLNKINHKPFPAALKYLDENKDNSTDTHLPYVNENTTNNYLPDLLNSIKNNVENKKLNSFPKNWLKEYEYCEENENFSCSEYDPSIPPSTVPCNGCGAHLHCANSGIPGYIPCEIFKGRTTVELKTIICQRCHFLKNYNIALDVTVKPEDYITTLSVIKDKYALAVLIVDLLDFPCSIWSKIDDIVGSKRPVIVVGNKVDLLPRDSKGYLENIKDNLTQCVTKILKKLNIKKTCLISAKTGYGVEELITQMHNVWGAEGDVYLIGCANVGKSSLFNALLRSDFCKVEATDLVKRATTSPWPGTTLKMLKFPILRPSDMRIHERYKRLRSESFQRQAEKKLQQDQLKETGKIKDATLTGHIGMTFNDPSETADPFTSSKGTNPILTLDENSKIYAKSKWCFDTPGVLNTDQIDNLLTTEELILLAPTMMITPRAFRMSQKMTLFLGGLGRLDFVGGNLNHLKIYVFSSMKLPVLITLTSDADLLYHNLLGSEYLGVPLGNKDRLEKYPKLEPSEITVEGSQNDAATCDILFSSAGWLSLKFPTSYECKFVAWTPEKRGIFVRKPALVRYPEKLCGPKVRKSLAYKIGKPFVLSI